jgi:hypothetical protein
VQDILDAETERAACAFMERVARQYDLAGHPLGAVRGETITRAATPTLPCSCTVLPAAGLMALTMAGIAFDVMLETGVLVEAIPLWEDEWSTRSASATPH